jgi:Uncharacterized conserved protein
VPPHERPEIPEAETTRNVLVRFQVEPQSRQAFVDAFAEAIPQARAAPGNHIFDLYQEADNPNGFVLLERWDSVASHMAHLGQPYSRRADSVVFSVLAAPAVDLHLSDVAP